MLTLYGIKNCDTVRKARKYLEQQQIEYHFHDFRADGLSKPQLQSWVDAVGWEAVLNKRGTTFRKLDDANKNNITANKALALMLAQPSMIKRPVLEQSQKNASQNKGEIIIGFNEKTYAQLK